jgi:hypothetical protein
MFRQNSKDKLFYIIDQILTKTRRSGDHAWHGARTIDQRADAQTQIQLNVLSLSTSGEPK